MPEIKPTDFYCTSIVSIRGNFCSTLCAQTCSIAAMFLASLTSPSSWPFVILAVSVTFIIIAISRLRLHAFVALILAALIAGLMTGKAEWKIPDKNGSEKTYSALVGAVELVSKGLGDSARDIAISIALASIIGMCLMESGAADKVVRRFLAFFGEKHAGWALLASTFLLSAPIFFDTMFMLMAPLCKALRLRTGKDYVLYILAVCCGGTITHSLMVPHPGPVAVVDDLKLDVGWSVIGGLIIGAIVSVFGFLVSQWLNRKNIVPLRETSGVTLAELEGISNKMENELPSFFWSVVPVILPIVLISLTTVFEVSHKAAAGGLTWALSFQSMLGGEQGFNNVRGWVDFLGHKNVALFIGAAISLWVLAKQCRFGLAKLEALVGPPLETAGMIILITSAGGAFGLALRNAGVGDAVKELAQGHNLNLIFLGWLVAAVIRMAQGSATVAMLTASSIMAPMLVGNALGCHSIYMFASLGFGAMCGSWMNDSGFWVVSRLSGMTEKETLRTWSIQLTADSLIGLVVTLVLSKVLPLV